MIKLLIAAQEFFDEENQTFEYLDGIELEFEHSLISLSKWESQTKKSFLSKDSKTTEELLLYLEAMIISPNYPPDIKTKFAQKDIDTLKGYIESPESATTFGTMPEVKGPGERITSELIYYWMVAFNIPFECETWHLNRLFSLIRICNIKNAKPKKMTRSEVAARNRALNDQRRAQYNTRG